MSTYALKADGTPLHRQLYAILRRDIVQGRYRVGDRLPTQGALCAQFVVSRITVRRALSDLQAAGLVRNEQGVGSFVTHRLPKRPAPANLGLIASVRGANEVTRSELLEYRTEAATPHVAERLLVGAGAEVLYVSWLRYSNGRPVLFFEAWLLPRFGKTVTPATLGEATLSQLLARDPTAVGPAIDEINAEAAQPAAAQALVVALHSPILRRERIFHDVGRRPIACVVSRSSGLRSRLLMEAGADQGLSLRAGLLIHDLERWV